jgi:hypothetical protein
MARKPTGKPVGPPEKIINWELFEQLCALQCTQSEICSMLKVNEDTLRKGCKDTFGEDYSALYKRNSECGKISVRRYQFVQAKTKPNMAIWLGKQWLGQKENVTELKELIVHEMRAGIRQISEESRSETIEHAALETKPSIPDCRP